MSLEGYLDQRDAASAGAGRLARRDAAERELLYGKMSDAERLLAFDRFCRRQLQARIDWTWAGAAKAKRIEQCRIMLETLVKGLWARGWLLDGAQLAKVVIAALDDVAKAQKAGRVRNFWMFYSSVVTRHVGTHAEELRDESKAVGAHASQVFQALTKRLPDQTPLPELVAQRAHETLREKVAKARRQQARKDANAAQQQLL